MRRPERADEASYARLFGTPEVARWLRPPPLRAFTLNDPAVAIDADAARWASDGFGFGVVEEAAGGAFVGRGGLQAATVAGVYGIELGWALLPDWWGRGLATELGRGAIDRARALGLGQVVAYTLPHNLASRGVMDKLGMTHDGDVEHAGLAHVRYVLTL